LRLILAPVLEKDSAAVILLLGHIEAADVEYAATAGACARDCRREPDKRSNRKDPSQKTRRQSRGNSAAQIAERRQF
jgi:hypothetical protein